MSSMSGMMLWGMVLLICSGQEDIKVELLAQQRSMKVHQSEITIFIRNANQNQILVLTVYQYQFRANINSPQFCAIADFRFFSIKWHSAWAKNEQLSKCINPFNDNSENVFHVFVNACAVDNTLRHPVLTGARARWACIQALALSVHTKTQQLQNFNSWMQASKINRA